MLSMIQIQVHISMVQNAEHNSNGWLWLLQLPPWWSFQPSLMMTMTKVMIIMMMLNIIDVKSHDYSVDYQIEESFNLPNDPEMCTALNDFVQSLMACRAEMQILGQIASGSKLWPEWASLMQCNEPRNCLQPSIAVLLEKCIAILRYRPLQLEKSGQEPVSGFNLPSGRCPLPSPHLCTIVHVSIATAVANVVFSIGILRSCLLLY